MDIIEEFRSFFKVPDISSLETVLFVQPHPDDVDLAVGGTVAKLSSLGLNVIYLTVTDGSAGTRRRDISREKIKEIRKKEQEEAGKVLGVKDVIWLDFEDLGDYTVEEARREILKVLRDLKPDMVFTVDPFSVYEVHPDHTKVGMATSQAVFFYNNPFIDDLDPPDENREIFISYYFTQNPNEIFCVDGYLQKKIEALSKHESQFGEFFETLKIYLEKKARILGKRIGCGYAEDFRVLHPMTLHAFPEVKFM